MSEPTVRVPDGMRDHLFDECTKRRELSDRMGDIFSERGYREVSTPELEYYELFTRTGSPLREEAMYKVIDRSGRICVLRPDSTTPIARLAATRLAQEPLPLRLWYAQPVFRYGAAFSGNRNGLWQAGIEHIGTAGQDCDADILRLAALTLQEMSHEIHIEIGHAGLFDALADELSIDKPTKETLRALIERKSFAALNDALDGLTPRKTAKDLAALMRLSGGMDALNEALDCETEALRGPLRELQALMEQLPGEHFSLDFGITQPIEYYTGVVFRGYIAGAAGAVLQGGRYDRLLSLLGRDAPAVGFAVDIDF